MIGQCRNLVSTCCILRRLSGFIGTIFWTMALVSRKNEAEGAKLDGNNSFDFAPSIHESAFVTVGDFIGVDEQAGFLRYTATLLNLLSCHT